MHLPVRWVRTAHQDHGSSVAQTAAVALAAATLIGALLLAIRPLAPTVVDSFGCLIAALAGGGAGCAGEGASETTSHTTTPRYFGPRDPAGAAGAFGQGDFNAGDFGQGDFNAGDFGQGDFGGSNDFGGGDFGRENTRRVPTDEAVQDLADGMFDPGKSPHGDELSNGVDLTPVLGDIKSVAESVLGRDLITGEDLSTFERLLNLGGLLGLNEIGKLPDASRAADDAADATRAADEAADATRGDFGDGGDFGGGDFEVPAVLDDVMPPCSFGGVPRSRAPGLAAPPRSDCSPVDPASLDHPRTQDVYDDLARDPAHGHQITDKAQWERKIGLELERARRLPGPITRDPSGAAEFVDANGIKWDVKSFTSHYPPGKGGFALDRALPKIQQELDAGENVILDTTNLTPDDLDQLRRAVDERGWSGRVVWWP